MLRQWCRAEQLCHLFRNGLDSMWIATSEQSIKPVSAAGRLEKTKLSAITAIRSWVIGGRNELLRDEVEAAAATLIQVRRREQMTHRELYSSFRRKNSVVGATHAGASETSRTTKELVTDWTKMSLGDWLTESIMVFEGDSMPPMASTIHAT